MQVSVLKLKPKGIIMSGDPASVYEDTPHADPALCGGIPIHGLCQHIAWRLSRGSVIAGEKRVWQGDQHAAVQQPRRLALTASRVMAE